MKRTLGGAIAAFFFLLISYLFGFSNIIAIILWSITGLVISSGIVIIYFYIRIKQVELKSANYDAKCKKYKSYTDGFGMTHLLNLKTDTIENLSAFPGTHHNGRWEEPPAMAAAAWQMLISKKVEHTPVKMLPEPQKKTPNLFDILAKAERVLVKGPTESGKTTLFRNIVQNCNETVIIVDPHYAPGLWPDGCKVVGKGRNHEEISRFLDWLSQELDRRYKLRARGDKSYKPLTIIIDEWMSISNRCGNATKIITEMITESRKSKMRLFIGSHSDQVEALGIKGQGKLREGLLIVRLYYDQVTGERRSTFDFGRGERDCHLYEPVSKMMIDDEDSKFVRLVESGATRQEASREVYGKDYAGTSHVRRCKGLLGE